MKTWMRRVRGAVGMGLTWAVTWFGAGMVILLGFLLTTGSTGADVPYPIGFGALGFLGGVTFSVVLSTLERRRTFEEMSLLRFAGWGAVGGLLFSTLFVFAVTLLDDPGFISNLAVLGPVFAAAGAASSAGALALARKGERQDALEAGADTTSRLDPPR